MVVGNNNGKTHTQERMADKGKLGEEGRGEAGERESITVVAKVAKPAWPQKKPLSYRNMQHNIIYCTTSPSGLIACLSSKLASCP